MRVITGAARGRKLITPSGLDTRPTTEMVKEAVFSAIQFELEGASVLDLFAGSGQMGIEALSRGARDCVLVDTGRESQQAIRQNLQTTGLQGRAKVVGGDVFAFLRQARGPFDIVFLDPPYEQGLAPRALEAVAPLVRESGAIFCETAKGETLPERVGSFVRRREYRFGKVKVTQYRVPQPQ